MKHEIKVPQMGESITEATVGVIYVQSGFEVAEGAELVDLETDKANQMLNASAKGVFVLSVKSGDKVKPGQVIGYIDGDQAAKTNSPQKVAPSTSAISQKEALKEVQEVIPLAATAPKPAPKLAPAIMAPPAITRSAAPIISNSNKPETRRHMTTVRKVIARRLVESQQTTAMLTTFNEVDMSAIMQIRAKYKDSFAKAHTTKLGLMSFFVKATAAALKAIPGLNSYIDDEDIVHREYYDIAIAVATERGLVVPVVRNCDQLSFAEIEQSIEAYGKRARESSITMEEMQGGCFTITNGGTYGSLLSTPILNPPQCGILGMHNIVKRPVVVDDQVVIRPMMYIALSYDHRIVDGKEAVTFLVHLKNSLEDPSRLLLDL